MVDGMCLAGRVFRLYVSNIRYGLIAMSSGSHAFFFGLQFALGALLVVPFFVVPISVIVSMAIRKINPVDWIDLLPLILCPLIWSAAEAFSCHMSERWLSVLYIAGAMWSLAFILRVCIVLVIRRNMAFLSVVTGLLPMIYIVLSYLHD